MTAKCGISCHEVKSIPRMEKVINIGIGSSGRPSVGMAPSVGVGPHWRSRRSRKCSDAVFLLHPYQIKKEEANAKIMKNNGADEHEDDE